VVDRQGIPLSNEHKEDEQENVSLTSEWSRLFAECFGAFALTLVDCGAKIVGALTGEVSPAAQALAPGLIVAAMIYSIGQRSGAHLNPAVTFAFAIRGVFSWSCVLGYGAAQLGGALLAAWLLHQLFGDVEHLGATMPRSSVGVACVMEVVLTFLLVSVILGTATQHRIVARTPPWRSAALSSPAGSSAKL